MSVQGLDVNMAVSSGAQAGGGEEDTPPALDTTGVAERPSLYRKQKYGNDQAISSMSCVADLFPWSGCWGWGGGWGDVNVIHTLTRGLKEENTRGRAASPCSLINYSKITPSPSVVKN